MPRRKPNLRDLEELARVTDPIASIVGGEALEGTPATCCSIIVFGYRRLLPPW